MSQNHFNHGMKIAMRWLQTGWPNDLNAIIADARAEDPARRNAGDLAFLGALITIAAALHQAQETGVKFVGNLPTVDGVVYARARGADDYSTLANTLLNTAAALRKAHPGLQFSFGQCQPGPMDNKPAPAKAEPLEVKIVGMPERQTTTTVTRDQEGSITSTIQVETDRHE